MTNAIVRYLEAGLDENLAKFMRGLGAVVIVTAGAYTYQHLSEQGAMVLQLASVALGGTGTLAVVRIWKWAKATAAQG